MCTMIQIRCFVSKPKRLKLEARFRSFLPSIINGGEIGEVSESALDPISNILLAQDHCAG